MIYYVTGNKHKFNSAQEMLKPFGINIEQKIVDIPEIQSDSIEEIAIEKAKKAYEQIKQPLFVNDSGWIIPALNGFPGPYMKYINDWLSPEDFINLMIDKTDRTSILRQVIVYIDENGTKTFENDSIGKILEKPSSVKGRSSDMVVSFANNLSVSEEKAKGSFTIQAELQLWKEFSNWLKEKFENKN